MKGTRRYNIRRRVFTKSDIRDIGKIFLDEYRRTQGGEHYPSVVFRIDCTDNTSYESEDLGLFDDGSIIDTKRISSIEITLYDYNPHRYMNITLVHGRGYNGLLTVRGDDQDWANRVFIKIKEIIDYTSVLSVV